MSRSQIDGVWSFGASKFVHGTANAQTAATTAVHAASTHFGWGMRSSPPPSAARIGFITPISFATASGLRLPSAARIAGLQQKRVKPMISTPTPASRPSCEKPRNSETRSTRKLPAVTTAEISAGRPALMIAARIASSYGLPVPSSSRVRKMKWMP